MFKAAAGGGTKAVGDAPNRSRWPTCSAGPRARAAQLSAGPWAAARGGEVDLILRESDGTLVFVEVRSRAGAGHGGALASVGGTKQRRIVRAAQHYLLRLPVLPPCRFDVVALDGGQISWIKAAFDGG